MNNYPSQHIFSHSPPSYPKQGWVHCGMYCVKNILSALGRDIHDDPRDYHISRWSRLQGRNHPTELAVILNQNGVRADVKTAIEMSDQEKLEVLKKELAQNHPVILLTNNAYTRSGKYFALQSWLLEHIACHWILLYGYSDEKEEFLIYDPFIDVEKIKSPPTIGNINRHYTDVLRDWKKVRLYSPQKFIYIPCVPT